jgi:hypothetical protein
MTITSLVRSVSYPGAGSTGPFAFPFKILQAVDLVVSIDGAVLVEGTDYTVPQTSVNNENGGSITLTDPLAVGETLTIERTLSLIQPTDIKNQGAYYPQTLENEFDRGVMIDQQLAARDAELQDQIDDIEVGAGGTPEWANILNKPATFPPEAHSAALVTSGALGFARMGGGTGVLGDVLSLEAGQIPAWKAMNAAIVGLSDPTSYGFTVSRTDQGAPATNSWPALSAAAYACYAAELDSVATGGSTTTLIDALAAFSATWDDRIDVGAGPDFSYEVCFLSGNNKGQYSNIDVRDSGTQLTLSPALPNAVIAGDLYRVIKSSRTQQRKADKVLRIPPGRARIDDEIVAIRGTASFTVQGSGNGVSILDFDNFPNEVNATTFTSATATTLTKTGAGWMVDQFKGRFVWTWADTAPRSLMCFGRIVSNTIDTLTVNNWHTGTPDAATQTFAVGLRSALFLNGIGGCTFNEFTVFVGVDDELTMGIAVQWMRPTYAVSGAEDRCAFSSSQNVFYRVEAEGRSVFGGMTYGNMFYAAGNQVDNGLFIGCRFLGPWTVASTDQRYSKAPLYLGDGNGANAVINTIVGGTCYGGQHGAFINWCDALFLGTTFQSNGHRSLTNDFGKGLGDVFILGISNYFGMYGCRSELSSRFISTAAANAIWQQAEIVQCSFHVFDDTTFALDGEVIHSELYGYWRLGGLWIMGNDPNGFTTPRPAKSYFNPGVVDVGSVACVESDFDTFFPTTLAPPLLNGVYARLNNDNTIQQQWIGGARSPGRTITAAYTATRTDSLIRCNASGGAFTVTLPAAAGMVGTRYDIKKVDSSANAITVDAAGAELIDGATTQSLAVQYDSITVQCNGTGWDIL